MKRSLFFLLLIFLLTDCKKEPLFDPFGHSGEVRAWVNGEEWIGTTGAFPRKDSCALDTCVLLSFAKKHDFDRYNLEVRGESIAPNYYPLRKGMYIMSNEVGYLSVNKSGAIITGYYDRVLETEEHYLEITELNLKTGDIKGNFQMTLLRNRSLVLGVPHTGQVDDTVRITNGSFYGKLNWKGW